MRTCGLVLSFIPFGWKLFLKVSIWEATAPQITFFKGHCCVKNKHRTPKGLKSPQHRKLVFYSRHHRFKNNNPFD